MPHFVHPITVYSDEKSIVIRDKVHRLSIVQEQNGNQILYRWHCSDGFYYSPWFDDLQKCRDFADKVGLDPLEQD